MKHHHFTRAEKEWLAKQPTTRTYQELLADFNARFGLDLKVDSIKDVLTKRMGIKRDKSNMAKTQFKDGAKPRYAIGDEVVKQGYVWVKVADEYFKGYNSSFADYKKNWKRKADFLWEEKYGEIPDGMFLIYLDKDTMNCDLDNLYLMDRSTHAVMNKMGWYSTNAELTLTAIQTAKLMREVRRRA